MGDFTLHGKHRLVLKLTESAVFLRSHDSMSRRHVGDQPGVLRALLVLNIDKPMKITSIVVNLDCCVTSVHPDGLGSRRIDVSEIHEVFSYEQTFFKAHPRDRRRSSLDPGFRAMKDSQDSSRDSLSPQSSTRRRPLSIDLSNFQTDAIEQRESHLSDTVTPGSTPRSSQTNDTHARPNGAASPPLLHPDISRESTSHSSLRSPNLRPTSSRGLDYPHDPPPSASSLSFHRVSSLASGQGPSRSPSPESRARVNTSGLSLTAMSNTLFDAFRLPPSHAPPSRSSRPSSADTSDRRGRSWERHDSVEEHRSSDDPAGAIERLKFHVHSKKHSKVEEWKEFRPGTYTYAITIPIGANQPPSLECSYGSVVWTLKATVHRPGTFTSKLTRSVNVNVIHSPRDEELDEADSISVERHWDQQLQYLIALSARHFYIGGKVPLTLTLLPLAKVKVHKLTVFLEERIQYLTQMSRVVRCEPTSHILLLSLRYPRSQARPILPLDSDDPEAFQKSPLFQLMEPGDDVSEYASSFMGPGPWTIRKDLQLPMSCSILHWTNKNKRSNVLITHTLKCILRVERENEAEEDSFGKKRLFDIVIQTEVEIRHCRCNPEWASLPPYTVERLRDIMFLGDKCPCEINRQAHCLHLPTKRVTSRTSSDSEASAAETAAIEGNMASLRGTDRLYRDNAQYERLVSGQETISGEVPPPYRTLPAN